MTASLVLSKVWRYCWPFDIVGSYTADEQWNTMTTHSELTVVRRSIVICRLICVVVMVSRLHSSNLRPTLHANCTCIFQFCLRGVPNLTGSKDRTFLEPDDSLKGHYTPVRTTPL